MPGTDERTKPKTGRPTVVNKPVKLDDGSVVTAGQMVIDKLRLGLTHQDAVDSAGISRQTFHTWRLQGARLRAQALDGRMLTAEERRAVAFLDDVEKAEALAVADRLAIIDGAARGGSIVTKTTVKTDADGNVTETTVVTETLRPEWTAAAWWLERKRPNEFGRRLALTGAEGGPLIPQDDAARGLADSLRDYLAGHEDGRQAPAPKRKAIPAESREASTGG